MKMNEMEQRKVKMNVYECFFFCEVIIVLRVLEIFMSGNQCKVSRMCAFVQNIERNTSLGAPFQSGALGCSP